MINAVLTGARVAGISLEGGSPIPTELQGRWREFSTKNVAMAPITWGEWGFSLTANSLTQYAPCGKEIATYQAAYKDGHLIFEDGLEVKALGMQKYEEVGTQTTDVYGFYENFVFGQQFTSMSDAQKSLNSLTAVAFKCKNGTSCNWEDITAVEKQDFGTSEQLDWDVMQSQKSTIVRTTIIDKDHSKILEADVKAFTDGTLYETINHGPIISGKSWITGFNELGEFNQVTMVGDTTVFQACKHHITNDNLWALIECGSSENKEINTIAKAHEDKDAYVTLGLACMSSLCDFSPVDPAPMTIANLLLGGM